MNPSAPILETERLRLRGHRPDDLAALVELRANPKVMRFIGGKPLRRQEVWAKLTGYVGHWALMGFGTWLVEEKTTGRFVGELGFAYFKRDITPSMEGVPEMGWVLAEEAHGKGYATEALKAVLAWGDSRWSTTFCIIDPGNTASLRVAAKCGFQESTRTTYLGDPEILFERKSAIIA